ncbi:DinB family protein [Aequorivita sp. SDUM287046]|uniref:DinB family protein n=1 Tax=Aequorivita aurantiaca TaxID=3053356 RepID=A0ABT8DQ37_9FLAO|nr:DinB family protein [Aequorivita aurantiaca]MDN3725330.1 DinB family protein [Aequorivita aurantiaca]
MESEELIFDLINRTQLNIEEAKKFYSFPSDLNFRFGHGSWSILECMEHLNLYGDYYIPAIKMAIESSNSYPVSYFKSGLMGNYFALKMLPNENIKKMKTFKDKNPLNANLNENTLSRFVAQQEQLLILLDSSKKENLNKIYIPVSFSRLVKLKLGDTFRFVIYHNERHIEQANKIAKAINSTKDIMTSYITVTENG